MACGLFDDYGGVHALSNFSNAQIIADWDAHLCPHFASSVISTAGIRPAAGGRMKSG